MTPTYFGSRQRRLFGIYEPATRPSPGGRAVVLCHPVGNEHIYAYRAMRQLAARLSQAGFHVLRFDYFGTGDSFGDTGDGEAAGWCEDIEAAIAEVKDMTAARSVAVVGLRLGANLAAAVAARRPGDIASLVLWDPVSPQDVPGKADAATDGDARAGPQPPDLSCNVAGLSARILVLLTPLASTRIKPSPRLEVVRTSSPSPWIEANFESGLVPAEALRSIVGWLDR